MKSLRVLDRQARYIVATIGVLLAVTVPGVISAIVSAATLTERSIALSSSSASAEDVSYTVNFTSVQTAGAFVVDFCSNSPVLEQECITPADFTAAGVTSADAPTFTVEALDANTIVVTGTIAAETDITVELEGINNSSAVGPIYARIVTYDTPENAELYVSDDLDPGTGIRDDGSAAIYITDTIGVSGAVLETMTFCVSKVTIAANCGGTLEAPVLQLGEPVGDTIALVPGDVHEGSIYTQITTNADGGAVISLKSSALNCGGLLRAGAPTACDIGPALDDGINTTGDAKFGVRTSTATGVGAGANGTLQPYLNSGYNNTTFAMNYALGNTTGVTSTYGDLFLDTNGNPANSQMMEIIFGAAVTNQTPAGLYSADLNLIATGKF